MSTTPLVALHAVLLETERFIASSEADLAQRPPVGGLLAKVLEQIVVVEAALHIKSAQQATATANAAVGVSAPSDDPAKAAARKAIHRLLQRIQREPRLAWHFDPITQSMADLTEAHALLFGLDVQKFRLELFGSLEFEAPTCGCGARAA